MASIILNFILKIYFAIDFKDKKSRRATLCGKIILKFIWTYPPRQTILPSSWNLSALSKLTVIGS